MDYAGVDARNLRYPVNRPLTDNERSVRLDACASVIGAEGVSYFSVIKMNSSYLELVDRWYPVKGFNVWIGLFAGFAVVPMLWLVFQMFIVDASFNEGEQWAIWAFWGFIVPMSAFIVTGVFWLVRSECFRWTHYPIRLNRRTRQVHVFRQDGTVMTAPWDRLFFFIGESTTPPIGRTNDLRMHLLSDDGNTVLETYTLGYVYLGGEPELLRLWEFIRQYMEEENGPERVCAEVHMFPPIHDRKEGFAFGAMRTFFIFMPWPILHLLFSLPFGFIAIGRWIAMSTSRIPVWPKDVEDANVVDDDDPWRRDWRNNPKFDFIEETWPLICVVIGVVSFAAILWSIEQSLR